MRYFIFFLLSVVALFFLAHNPAERHAYVNAHILTLDASNSVAQAMIVNDGRIEYVGTDDEARLQLEALADSDATVVDLQGATVMPGFVDGHSHFPSGGIASVAVDLSPPPAGDVTTLETLLEKIELAAKDTDSDDWVLGYNYDNTVYNTGAHPTREQLDAVAPNRAVYLWHNSGHMGVANSVALSRLSKNNPRHWEGRAGVIRDHSTGKLTGLLQERAAPQLSYFIKQLSPSALYRIFTTARDRYLAAGVTTVQNGYADQLSVRMLRVAQWLRVLPQRVVVWPTFKEAHLKKIEQNKAQAWGTVNNGDHAPEFQKGAVKIIVDGSPQGMTAYLSRRYFKHENRKADFRGIALLTHHELLSIVEKYHRAGFQLAMHGNGDAAIELIIDAVARAQSEHHRPDARHILVHAQTIREDQINRMAGLSLYPSFFITHTYYWGDWHRTRSLGPKRAEHISPLGWADKANLSYTLHTDAPVTPIRPFELVWSAITRQTVSGHVLGRDQRTSRLSALRAVTINAAWQNHMDKVVGSLEPGKFADFIVLSDNPLSAADPRSILVESTFINGIKRFSR